MTVTGFLRQIGGENPAAVRSSLRKSLTLALTCFLAVLLLGSAAASLTGMLLAGVSIRSATLVAFAAFGTVAALGFTLVRLLASTLSTLSSKPIELLLEQTGVAGEPATEDFKCMRGRALTRRQAQSDVDALCRLIRRASARSAELLRELNEMRERASAQRQASSDFEKISCALRAPLNTILGYATLLREDALERAEQSAADDAERILLAGRKLLSAISDPLDLAGVEAGSTGIDCEAIDIRGLAQSVISSDDIDADDRRRLELHVDGDIGIMVGDKKKLRRCLLRLLADALDFASSGMVRLAIARTSHCGVASISFSIAHADSIQVDGEAAVPRAFGNELHHRRRSDDYRIGFAIARRLAHLMGGDCTVRNGSSAGTSFTLTLPLGPNGDQQLLGVIAGPQAAELARKPGGFKCALVVDDDESALDLMRRWLGSSGYDVLIALDGETGLRLAREHRPDLIFLDALLPGRSGYEILAELRSDPAVASVPVVLVTVDDDRCRGIRCGASDYLRKPLAQADLRALLNVYAPASAGEILVIEDDDDAAELIRRGVEEVGFSTRRARDGVEGIDMASAEPPAAIVLDMRMPKLDGFGVIERLGRVKDLSVIPIVVVSGHDIDLAEHRRLAAAGHRVFTKGMATPREIAQSLRELVA